VIILGAGGRDFHNFNTVFRGNPNYRVVAFTATQIPNIEDRVYPPALAGRGYQEGIPVYPEADLPRLIREHDVEEVVFSYSDVSHEHVMHVASLALARGASFRLLSPQETMLQAAVPVVAVCAVRSGAGKSPASREVARLLRAWGSRVAVVRHPMPYGDLRRSEVQRFASWEDLDLHRCSIEEREEYEPHLEQRFIVYAGVDYGKVLEAAGEDSDVLVWDGGNNDLPFYKPDLLLVLVDPLRAGDELRYHPGETALGMADAVIISKVDTASEAQLQQVEANISKANPSARILRAALPIELEGTHSVRGKRVLVIEDGPTITHGGMPTGAGYRAAMEHGAAAILDPRPWARGRIAATYQDYPHIGPVLPAVGYDETQRGDLQATIAATPCDVVVVATPTDLRRVMTIEKPSVRTRYRLQVRGTPTLEELLQRFH